MDASTRFEMIVDSLKDKDLSVVKLGDVKELVEYADRDPAKVILCIDDELEEELNKMGYFNVINTENRFELTDDEFEGLEQLVKLLEVISPEVYYNFNRTQYIQKQLLENQNLKTATVILQDLLYAINTNDSDKFKNIVKYSLDSLIQSSDDLQKALTTIDADILWEHKYNRIATEIYKLNDLIAQRDEAIKKLNTQLDILSEYKAKYAEIEKVKAELEDALKSNGELAREIADLKVATQNMVSKSEVQDLLTEKNVLEEQVDELNKQIYSQKAVPEDTHKDTEIEMLKAALREAQSKSSSNIDETMLPCIDDNMYVNSKKIILLKEIQPCIYLMTLLKWLKLYSEKLEQNDGTKVLVLIFDKLDNNYTIKKYTKNNISVNTAPLNHIVVTNKLDKTFLKNVLDISQYNYIYVIDRLGFQKSVMNRSDMFDYYFINSPSDISDFKLKTEKCVAFYNSKGKVPYEILPDADIASNSNDRYSVARMFKTDFISKCLTVQ